MCFGLSAHTTRIVVTDFKRHFYLLNSSFGKCKKGKADGDNDDNDNEDDSDKNENGKVLPSSGLEYN